MNRDITIITLFSTVRTSESAFETKPIDRKKLSRQKKNSVLQEEVMATINVDCSQLIGTFILYRSHSFIHLLLRKNFVQRMFSFLRFFASRRRFFFKQKKHPQTISTDWLSSRRLVSDTWSRDLERLQVRARKAKESMKKERWEKVLPKRTFEEADKGIPYQDCVMIVNNLMKDDSSTNFLGQYKDASLYDWDKIKRDYEKSGLCIAQIARDLISLCKYEIPALRDELEEMQKREGHSEQNLTSLDRSLKIAANELSTSCEDIGIETNDVAGLNSESQIESRILRSVRIPHQLLKSQEYHIRNSHLNTNARTTGTSRQAS